MANFIAVVGRDRQFADAQAGFDQLNNYFRVKMKLIGVAVKRHLLERGDRVNPIAGVKLT